MWDWNNNGKYDLQDSFIDYHINKSISDNNTGNKDASFEGTELVTVIGIGLLILGIFCIFA